MPQSLHAYRAALLHCIDDPESVGIPQSYQYIEDGLLVVEQGLIKAMGEAEPLLATLPANTPVTDYRGQLITPGFVDTHIHYPQTGMIASYGEQLLDWLNNYTFVEEQKFADFEHASTVANRFLDELLRNGTTTALVFGTVHPESVDAFFTAAQARQLRMIAGKVMMDRNAPEALTDTPQRSYDESKALIERWHKKDRLLYAVTPRFAPTSSDEQLAKAGQLLKEYPDLYLHTHLSENRDEIDWVKALFPAQSSYLDVYDHFELLSERSVFAHGVHLCDSECQRLAETGSSIAFCPTSNLFLGSGLFDLAKMDQHGVQVALGTDVGGGTSFSMLQTAQEAYKILQLQRQTLHPIRAFYLATLGGAKALRLSDKIGTLQPGSEADFIVLDPAATPLLDYRTQNSQSIEDLLFALMTLGDDRAIAATFVAGHQAQRR